MARTPLLRALRCFAREHDAAERLGIAPGALRRRRTAEPSRRDFLKAIAAIGALTPASGIAPALASSQARIAIVGAGISGLTAALALKDEGLAATVYEASPRIGGRMHSDRSGYWAEKQVSEFCGELIDSGHTTILGLATRFGLAVDDLLAAQPLGSTDTYWFLGGRYPAAQADSDFVPVREALKRDLNAAGYPTLWNKFKPTGYALDHMSVYDWIETRVPGGHSSPFGRLLDTAYSIEYGAETTEQSSLNLVYLLAYQPSPNGFAVFGVSDEQYHIRGGNQRLPDAIAGVLPDIRPRWRPASCGQRRKIGRRAADRSGGGRPPQRLTASAGVIVSGRVLSLVPGGVRHRDHPRPGRLEAALGELCCPLQTDAQVLAVDLEHLLPVGRAGERRPGLEVVPNLLLHQVCQRPAQLRRALGRPVRHHACRPCRTADRQ